MKTYYVSNFYESKINWELVEPLEIAHFPWYQSGKKQATYVKMAFGQDCIHLNVQCEDVHSSAENTEFNGSVYLDSCFEFFVTPKDQRGASYLNLEVNCCKTLHMAFGPDITKRTLATLEQGKSIEITSSILTSTKEECLDDKDWRLTIKIPMATVEEMTGYKIEDTIWYGNFYRCGGKTEPQYATWQPTMSEVPAFHEPHEFGQFIIQDWDQKEGENATSNYQRLD